MPQPRVVEFRYPRGQVRSVTIDVAGLSSTHPAKLIARARAALALQDVATPLAPGVVIRVHA